MLDDVDAPLRAQLAEARRLRALGRAGCSRSGSSRSSLARLAPLASAIVAQAFVKVDLDRRPVQHAEGGIVREVLRAGRPARRAGRGAARAGRRGGRCRHEPAQLSRAAEQASIARLEAEQTLRRSIAWPAELVRRRRRPASRRADRQGEVALRRPASCAARPDGAAARAAREDRAGGAWR